MTASEFVDALKSFGETSFTKEQLRQKVIEIAGNDKNFTGYFWDYKRRPIRGASIIDLGNGQFKASIVEKAKKAQSYKGKRRKSKKEPKPKLEELLGVNKLTYKSLADDEALQVFLYTFKKFKDLAHECGVSVNESYRYFKYSDADFLSPPDYKKAPIQFIFKQLAFHAQNGQVIKNVIKWDVNESVMDSTTNGYDPTKPLSKTKKEFSACFGNLNDDKKKIVNDYYDCLSDVCEFLKNKTTSDEVCNALIAGASTPLDYIGNVKKHIKKRYGEALTFDFIKEFGKIYGYSALDFPKPDLHIKRTMAFILIPNMGSNPGGYLSKYKTTDFNADALDSINTINDYLCLMNKVRRSYVKNGGKQVSKLINYLMDKMVFIICSGKLYLHNIEYGLEFGANYTKGLGDKDYLNIVIKDEMPLLENFLRRI